MIACVPARVWRTCSRWQEKANWTP